MDRFIHNNDFSKDVIYEKMSKIASELEKMEKKPQEERNEAREKELIYARFEIKYIMLQ